MKLFHLKKGSFSKLYETFDTKSIGGPFSTDSVKNFSIKTIKLVEFVLNILTVLFGFVGFPYGFYDISTG